MSFVRVARTAAFAALLATSLSFALGACSSSGSAGGASGATPTSVPGCGLPPDTPPGRILDLSIAQEFYDEHLFADPAPAYHIIEQGKVANTIDFNQWWDKHEGDQHLLLGGKTMSDWELDVMQHAFPDRGTVYAGYCSGWRFSAYLRQHQPATSATATTTTTTTQG